MEETATSILQGADGVSNQRAKLSLNMSKKNPNESPSTDASGSTHDQVAQLRTLAHDLSNALESILQASYLLGQATLDENSQRWAGVIEKSSAQAAKINRELRRTLRSMSEE